MVGKFLLLVLHQAVYIAVVIIIIISNFMETVNQVLPDGVMSTPSTRTARIWNFRHCSLDNKFHMKHAILLRSTPLNAIKFLNIVKSNNVDKNWSTVYMRLDVFLQLLCLQVDAAEGVNTIRRLIALARAEQDLLEATE